MMKENLWMYKYASCIGIGYMQEFQELLVKLVNNDFNINLLII